MRVVYWARMKLAQAEVSGALQAVPGVDLTMVESLDDLLAALPGAEALVLYDAPADQAQKVVDALGAPDNSVRWIHFLTAGREGFGAVGLPPGIPASYPAGAVSPTVAEHAMTLLLAMTRRVPAMLEEQAQRNWARIPVSAKAVTLEGGRMAIVGYGQIGREIARRAKAFGVTTIGVSRSAKADEFLDEYHPLSDLASVLATADFVVLSIAQTSETEHLFDAAMFAACKPGAFLVNIARGGLVDQTALAEALCSGRLGGAGLDAQDPEPLPASDPLWDAPNLILSPHFAGGGSAASRRRLGEGAAANLQSLMAGEPLRDLIT